MAVIVPVVYALTRWAWALGIPLGLTDMFFRDRTNLAVMAFFVVSAVFSLWVNFSIRGGDDAPRFRA